MERTREGWPRRALWLLSALAVLAVVIWWRVFLAMLLMLGSAALLAALLLPLAQRFERRMRPGSAAGLALVLLLTALLLFLGLVLPAMVVQAQQLLTQLPTLMGQLSSWIEILNGWFVQAGLPPLPDLGQDLVAWDSSLLLRDMMSFAGGVMGRLAQWALVPVIAFYFLRDRAMFCHRLSLLAPIRYRRSVLLVAAEMRRALIGYLQGQLIVASAVGGLTGLMLLLIGAPAWLALGAWMALCDLIPYFGPVLGAFPVLLFAGAIGWRKVAWALLWIVIIQQLEANFLSPRVLGGQTGLHPVTVLFSLAVGNMLFGLWGLLLSLPVVVMARACVRTLEMV